MSLIPLISGRRLQPIQLCEMQMAIQAEGISLSQHENVVCKGRRRQQLLFAGSVNTALFLWPVPYGDHIREEERPEDGRQREFICRLKQETSPLWLYRKLRDDLNMSSRMVVLFAFLAPQTFSMSSFLSPVVHDEHDNNAEV